MENFFMIGLFVSLGLLLRRVEAFPKDTAQALNMFALYISLPALVLLKAPTIAFSRDTMVAAIIPWALLLFSAAVVLVAGRLWRWSRPIIGVLLLVIPLGNTSFMGIPMVNAFYGAVGLSHLIVYDLVGTLVIFATYGSIVLSIYGKDSALTFSAVAKRILLFPSASALVLGLLFSDWFASETVARCLQSISSTLVPLVMTAIGFQLRLKLPARVIRPLFFGLGIKLIAAPIMTLLVFQLLGITGLVAKVAVMEAGMPPMVVASAMAVIAGMEAELAVALVGAGIILSFCTIPLLYWLMQIVGI